MIPHDDPGPLGILVAVITFACLLAAKAMVKSYYADQNSYQTHRWPMSVAFVATAAIAAPASVGLVKA